MFEEWMEHPITMELVEGLKTKVKDIRLAWYLGHPQTDGDKAYIEVVQDIISGLEEAKSVEEALESKKGAEVGDNKETVERQARRTGLEI